MSDDTIEQAASFLVESGRMRQRRNLPDTLRPTSEAEAVAICEAVWRKTGGDPAGWKIGAADPKARAAMGMQDPWGQTQGQGRRWG